MRHQSPENDMHDISIVMINSDGYYITLNTEAVHDMQIEECLTRWWSRGYVDIKNEHDFIERAPPAGGRVHDLLNLDEKEFTKGKTSASYVFRNDGTDIMYITLQTPAGEGDSFHTYYGTFNIYDIQEAHQNTKIKRLMIRDERYQRMLHTNIPWSTTSITTYTDAEMRHGADLNRRVHTGNAIKSLMRLSLGDSTPFSESWDIGHSETMYTSPANFNCIDDLNYLLDTHVSSESTNKGKSILYYDRPVNQWRLVTLPLMFAYAAHYESVDDDKSPGKWLAGSLQTEAFKLLSYPDPPGLAKSGPIRVPLMGDGVYQNYNLGEKSYISSIEYHEINSSDNLMNIVTSPVHMYNSSTKSFHIKQSENSIDSIYNELTSMVGNTPHDNQLPTSISMDVNTNRKFNTNIRHHFSTSQSGSSYLNKGINSAVYNSVLLSNAVEFNVPGHPSRGVGRFVSIGTETTDTNSAVSPYHDKVIGQYLVTSVIHRYTNNTYTNQLIGVKPYNFKPVHNTIDDEPESFEGFNMFNQPPPQEIPAGDFNTTGTIEDFFSNP